MKKGKVLYKNYYAGIITETEDGEYIFKPPNEHFPEMPENEHVTMRMAEAMGFALSHPV
jgi:hypothetical protein